MNQERFTPGSVLAKNTLLNLTGTVLPLLVGVLAIPYAIRGLGNEGFGILSYTWVIIGYFSILDFGVSRATTKFIAESIAEKNYQSLSSTVWTASITNVMFGTLGAAGLIMLTPHLVEEILKISPDFIHQTKLSFYLAACSLPVILFSTCLRGALGAAQRFDLVNIVFIPVSVLSFVFPALSYYLGIDLFTVILLIILSRCLSSLLYLYFCLRVFPGLKTRPIFEWKILRKLLSYGGWVTITGIISPVMVYVDRFFIGSFLSVSVVAYYTVPYDTINRLRALPIAVMTTLFPEFSALSCHNETARVETLFGRSIKYILLPIGLITLLLLSYAPGILRFWLNEQFAENASTILRILAIGILVNSIAYIPFNLLQGIGKPDIPAKFHMVELPFYIISLWYLISKFGIIGAASAWLIRVTLDFALLSLWSVKYYPTIMKSLSRNRIWREVFLLFTFGVSLLLIRLFVSNLITEILSLLIMLAVTAASTWNFILDRSERKTLLTYSRVLFPG